MATKRVRDFVKLTSPEGDKFKAKWVGGPRDFSKRVNIISYADINGEVADDYGAGSTRYPIDMIFDGEGYEEEANKFFNACLQQGKWKVIHPTKGFKGLQLLSITEDDDPIRNANGISVKTQWTEFIDPYTLKTWAQMKIEAHESINKFNFKQIEKFSDIKKDTFSDRTRLTDMAEGMAKGVDKILGPVADINSHVSQKMQSVQRDLQSMLSTGVIEPLKLASLLQQTIQIPMLATRDLWHRLNACKSLAKDIFTGHTEDWDPLNIHKDADYNSAAMQELALSSVIANFATLAITSDIKTKVDAIALIEEIEDMIASVAEHLDVFQKGLQNALIKDQYFAQEGSYNDMLSMISKAKEFLIDTALNLKIEKKFTLKQDSTVIEQVLQWYGKDNISENTSFFIETNNIMGDELFVIPAGREISIYV